MSVAAKKTKKSTEAVGSEEGVGRLISASQTEIIDRGKNKVTTSSDRDRRRNKKPDNNDGSDEEAEQEENGDGDQLQSNYAVSLNRSQANLVASEFLPKKRTARKKVTRPKHANNPFLVYSIYFTNQNQSTTNQQLEQKLKPWERNYFHNLNNRMRGAHSVTAGDSRSIMYHQQVQGGNSVPSSSAAEDGPAPVHHPSSTGKHQNQQSSQKDHSQYRKYARSLRRSTNPPQATTDSFLIQQSLNANRSLPPLRESADHGAKASLSIQQNCSSGSYNA